MNENELSLELTNSIFLLIFGISVVANLFFIIYYLFINSKIEGECRCVPKMQNKPIASKMPYRHHEED
jgi:hypothetical protein